MTKVYPPHANKQRLAHGVDVLIPSDTEQFDSISPIEDDEKEVYQKLLFQLSRAKSIGRAFLNSKNGPITILEELYIQKVLARAELVILSKIVEEKLGISANEFILRTAEQVEKMMDMEQIANKLLITPDGVFRDR